MRRGRLVTAFLHVFLGIRVRLEGLQPCIQDAVAAPGSLDAGARFLDPVDGLKVLVFGVLEEVPISDMEEQFVEELVRRRWHVMPLVSHHGLHRLLGPEQQKELASDDDQERDHADAPKILVVAGSSGQGLRVELAVALRHPGHKNEEDGLMVKGDGVHVREGHLLVVLVDEDGGLVFDESGDPDLTKKAILSSTGMLGRAIEEDDLAVLGIGDVNQADAALFRDLKLDEVCEDSSEICQGRREMHLGEARWQRQELAKKLQRFDLLIIIAYNIKNNNKNNNNNYKNQDGVDL